MANFHYDADVLCYRIGYTTQDVEEGWIVEHRLHTFLNTLREAMGVLTTDKERFFLSDSSNNFRFKIFPEYKANRPPKPRWTPYVRQYLLDEMGAEVVPYHEADDALAMYQTEDSVCVSIDKDLLQIPGAHFNMVKQDWSHMEEFDGLKWFYRQILMGDNTDNLSGLWRIGEAKSYKLLRSCTTEEEMWDVVTDMYWEKETPISVALRNAQCMWCYRNPVDIETLNGIWLPPNQR